MTADLVQFLQFLRARLDEDETHALIASGEAKGTHWSLDEWFGREEPHSLIAVGNANHPTFLGHFTADPVPTAQATHVARNDPARVLAEVTWRRIIVGNYAALLKTFGGVDWAKGKNDPVMSGTLAAMETLHSVLRAMATVYADHPDYREEWKP